MKNWFILQHSLLFIHAWTKALEKYFTNKFSSTIKWLEQITILSTRLFWEFLCVYKANKYISNSALNCPLHKNLEREISHFTLVIKLTTARVDILTYIVTAQKCSFKVLLCSNLRSALARRGLLKLK